MTNHEQNLHYTAEEVASKRSQGQDDSDWQRLDALTEDELEAAIDHEEEGDFDWSKVEIGMPAGKQQLTVRFDLDVVEWFRAQGSGYQTRMNQVLRSYVDAHRRK